MAKQVGQLQLRGSINNLTFSQTPFGNIAKRKSGPTRTAVLRKPNFARTRENAADFKTAVHAATIIRHALQPYLKGATNVWLNGRMNGLLLKAVRSDKTNSRGNKAVPAGALSILKGFEINHENTLTKKLRIACKTKIDAKGNMQVTIPSFIPKKTVNPPDGATHFMIVSSGVALDVKKFTFNRYLEESPLLAINRKKLPPLTLRHAAITTAGQSLLLAVGILFYKMIDGQAKQVKGGAMKIVEVREVVKNKQ